MNPATYRDLFRDTPEARLVLGFDEQGFGTVLDVSDTSARRLGYSRSELGGLSFADILCPGNADAARHLAALAPGEETTCETKLIARDGRAIPLNLAARCHRAGGRTVVLATCHPLTEHSAPPRNAPEAGTVFSFEETFEIAAVGLAHVGLDGTWLRVNRRLCAILGYEPEELLDTSFQQITHPDDLATDLAFVDRLRQREIATYSMEKRYFRKDGSAIWIELSVALARDPETDEPTHFVAVVVDIAARKQAHAALADRERSYRLLAEYASDMISRHTPEGEYLDVTPAARRLLGYEPEELIGHSAYDFFCADDLHAIRRSHAAILEEDDSLSTLQYRIRGKDGSMRWVETRSRYIREAGWPEEIVAVTRDISKQKRIEEDLRRARDNAELASGAKSRFLANMSHELRTPLNAIIGYTEMVQEEVPDQADVASDLARILQASRYLLSLVDDVLTLTQLESGPLALVSETVHLPDVVDEAVATTTEHIARRNNRLLVDVPSSEATLITDRARLRQCLEKLLENAARDTEHGQIQLSVRRADTPEGTVFSFRVSDTGDGIDDEQLDLLFEPFVTTDSSSTSPFGGMGLGLAVTQRLATTMGGHVSVESTSRQGTTFTLVIPAAPPPAHEAMQRTDSPLASTSPSDHTEATDD